MREAPSQSVSAQSYSGPASWSLDLASGKLRSSAARAQMLGYEASELQQDADGWDALLHPDECLAVRNARARHLLGADSGYSSAYRARRRDGSWAWLLEVGCIDRDRHGAAQRISGTLLDISAEREAQLRLQQRLACAERLASAGRLAAGVAHEINTPVQFVSDSVYFINDAVHELLQLTERLRLLAAGDLRNANSVAALCSNLPYLVDNLPKALERSLEGLQRVAEIVRSMRELARPDRAEMTEVDLNHVIRNALLLARSEYRNVAEVHTNLSPLPPVRCHGGELNQVILNLLINAAQAVSDARGDSGPLGVIRVASRRDGDSVLVSIADSGSGIAEHHRPRIFEPFFTTKEAGRGTGQGLAISHDIIVNRHGGSIDFHSEPGGGTVFTLRLPLDCRAQPSQERAA
jgi:PAS domain S-box-containing protein